MTWKLDFLSHEGNLELKLREKMEEWRNKSGIMVRFRNRWVNFSQLFDQKVNS